jgi:GNAT superfamily N-acetyltransferase
VAHVRYGSAVDAEAISRVRHDAWRAAYAGIIMAEIIDRATGVRDADRERALFVSRPWRRTLVAESVPGPPAAAAPPSVPTPAAPRAPAAGPAVPAPATGIIGYASFGPERGVDGSPLPERADRDGSPRPGCAELYALYVTPAWWSTGTGRDLMCRVLEETRTGGYQRIVLWVLEQNSRARRFYERAGFRLDGRSFVPDWLGGVTEVCYARDLDGP